MPSYPKLMSGKIFCGILSAALLVVLAGCERPMSNQPNNNLPEGIEWSFEQSEADKQEAGEQTIISKPAENVSVTDFGKKYEFDNPQFSFETAADLKVETRQRQLEEKTNEIFMVSIVAQDLASSKSLTPNLALQVYQLSDEVTAEQLIADCSTDNKVEVEIINQKSFQKTDSSGLVDQVSYFIENNGLLYLIAITPYGGNDQLTSDANSGFVKVLETLQF